MEGRPFFVCAIGHYSRIAFALGGPTSHLVIFGIGDDDSFDCCGPTIGINESLGESRIVWRIEERIEVWDSGRTIRWDIGYIIARKMHKARNAKRTQTSVVDRREEARLKAVIESIGSPREPMVKFYRLPGDGRHILVGAIPVFDFPFDSCEEYLRDNFGGGEYIVRTVRSNGTFGPSRIVRIAENRHVYNR
jgi:hypothetical protein